MREHPPTAVINSADSKRVCFATALARLDFLGEVPKKGKSPVNPALETLIRASQQICCNKTHMCIILRVNIPFPCLSYDTNLIESRCLLSSTVVWQKTFQQTEVVKWDAVSGGVGGVLERAVRNCRPHMQYTEKKEENKCTEAGRWGSRRCFPWLYGQLWI